MRRLGRAALGAPVALADLIVRNYSLFFLLVALIVVSTFAGVTGQWLFYRAAYVIGGLLLLCLAWARMHVRGLDVTAERTTERLQVGQVTETRLRLRNRSIFTKLWLEVEDETDMPGRSATTVMTLPAKNVRNWKILTRCRRRGLYTAGPVKITTGDPFGLFRFTRRFGDSQPVLVLPRPEELPYFTVPPAQLPGEGAVHKRTHYVTPNASGVREYYPGDSYNRVHWKSTARLGRLMVKTFEMDPTSNVWVVLDLHRDVQAGQDDESTEEYGVRIATSLLYRFFQSNRMFGLLMDAEEREVLEPSRGEHQYMRALERLAVARATGQTPLADLLEEEGRRFGRHSSVIIVTPSLEEDWVSPLSLLQQQGARMAVVLLEAGSFGGAEADRAPLQALAAGSVPVYEVRAGYDLSLALGPAGMLSGAGAEQYRHTAALAGAR